MVRGAAGHERPQAEGCAELTFPCHKIVLKMREKAWQTRLPWFDIDHRAGYNNLVWKFAANMNSQKRERMRMIRLWNDNWQFACLPLGSVYEDMKAAAMRPVTLPHDWLIKDTDHLYASGDGWYRKDLRYDPDTMKNQALILSFDGIYMDADILVNGRIVFTHRYGYTAFWIYLQDHLLAGTNEIAVHIRHQSPNSRWYSGAGIYRDVRLMFLPRHHMLPDGFQVNTIREADGWVLDASTELSEEGELPHACLMDPAGVILAQGDMEKNASGAQITLRVHGIVPWDVSDSPALYRLVLTLGEQTNEISVGFRETRFDPQHGFFLNGEPLKIHGVCLHHDLGALGAAFYEAAAERQLRIMKEMGVNAIRTAHNPPARSLLDLCDRMGLLVMDEAYDMWEMAKTPYDNARFFPDTYQRTVAEWVRRDRCHPCVILWSIGNEIQDMNASERGQMWTRALMEEVRKHDSRHAAVTFGSNYMPWEGAQKCADIVKLPGYNYAEKYYDAHHRAHPDWVIFGSETASLLASRGIYHFPISEDILSDEDLQCSALLNSNTSCGAQDLRKMLVEDRLNPYTLGQFIWSGIDYIGEPTPYHTRNCYFGQTDTACFPKDAYYFYQAMWTDAPMIHIGIYWDWNEGQLIDVPVMTNGAAAELFLNGKSLGVKPVDLNDIEKSLPVWRVPFARGILEARAYDGQGKLLCKTVRESFEEGERISLKADRAVLRAGRADLGFVTVSVLDRRGRIVENAVNRVHVKVTGKGRLLGMDNGDSTDREGYQTDSRRLFSGKLLLIVGAEDEPGTIDVKVSGNGLHSASVSFRVEASTEGEERKLPAIAMAPAREDAALIRRICIRPLSGTVLTPEKPQALFEITPLPKEAAPQEIRLRITNAQGVDMPCVRVEQEGNLARLTGLGDGRVYLRAAARNGYSHTRVLSLLDITAQGFGPMGLDPYGFIAGSLYDMHEGEIAAGNEQGLSFARENYSAAGFSHVDFGPVGSDEITLPIFALDGGRYDLSMWDGMPGQGGKLIAVLAYQKPSIWNTYQPETYKLPVILRGVHTIAFSLDRKIHLKGFSFTRQSRAERYNRALDADQIYGDSYSTDEDAVCGIGNNVTLQFTHMFFERAGEAVLCLDGATELDTNAVNVQITNEEGEERLSMCPFRGGAGRQEQRFQVAVPQGRCTVSFIFLPGSRFDFYGFTFGKKETGHE